MITISFSGHRPGKLGGYNWNTPKNQAIMKNLKETIICTLFQEWENDKSTKPYKEVTFIFGGALGIDQMAFEVCEDIRDTYEGDYNFILAMPFEKQDANWFKQEDKDRLKYQREQADKVVLVDTLNNYKIKDLIEGEYHPAKMQKRNEYMLDNSDLVIAVWDGSNGGTANCVRYAKKLGKKIIQINPNIINGDLS